LSSEFTSNITTSAYLPVGHLLIRTFESRRNGTDVSGRVRTGSALQRYPAKNEIRQGLSTTTAHSNPLSVSIPRSRNGSVGAGCRTSATPPFVTRTAFAVIARDRGDLVEAKPPFRLRTPPARGAGRRCARRLSITDAWVMNAGSRMGPRHVGHAGGSTSTICWSRAAQRRAASVGAGRSAGQPYAAHRLWRAQPPYRRGGMRCWSCFIYPLRRSAVRAACSYPAA
jgi:hypothetical protein